MLTSTIGRQNESSDFLQRFYASAVNNGVMTCFHCGLVATLRCTCKKAHYCGVACQRADWANHRAVHRLHAKPGI